MLGLLKRWLRRLPVEKEEHEAQHEAINETLEDAKMNTRRATRAIVEAQAYLRYYRTGRKEGQ